MTTISEQLAVIGGQADATIAALNGRISELGDQAVLDDATIAHLTAVLDACQAAYAAYRAKYPPPFTLGVTEPTAANTGVPAGRVLKVVTGDMVITTPGTVLDGLDINGYIDVRCADVTINECITRGGAPSTASTRALISAFHPAVKNLQVTRCTAKPAHPAHNIDFLDGHDYTATRNDVSEIVDSFGVFGPNVKALARIHGNYGHDYGMFLEPTAAGGVSHNDSVQIQAGADIEIIGNAFWAYGSPLVGVTSDPALNPRYPKTQTMSCVMIGHTPAAGPPIADVKVHSNWFRGSLVPVNISDKGSATGIAGLVVADNRASKDSYYPGSMLTSTRPSYDANVATWTGNTWIEDGTPATFTRQKI